MRERLLAIAGPFTTRTKVELLSLDGDGARYRVSGCRIEGAGDLASTLADALRAENVALGRARPGNRRGVSSACSSSGCSSSSYAGSFLASGRTLGCACSIGYALGPLHVSGIVGQELVTTFEPLAQVSLGWLALVIGLDFGRTDQEAGEP